MNALSDRHLRVIFEHLHEGITLLDADGVVFYASPSLERLLGYSVAQFLTLKRRELLHPDDLEPFLALLNRLRTRPAASETIEYRFRDAAGNYRHLEARVTNLLHEAGLEAFLVNYRDLTAGKARLSQLTHYDPLTGLANRVLFRDRLEQGLVHSLRHESLLALLFLDLDGFKFVNDSLGHSSGDALLQAVAESLKSLLRPGDTLARSGGDEFSIILRNLEHGAEAAEVAQRLLKGLLHPFSLAGQTLHISGSVGIALYPHDGEDAETLIRHADTAMYRAKTSGRNTYRYFLPEMNQQVAERLTLETELRAALERDQFVLYYQPRVRLSDNRITCCEALVRWQHPTRGLVMPGDFIPLAEELGLIHPLGLSVLRMACEESRRWQDAGVPLKVAVNLSVRQLQDPSLPLIVERILFETGLEPHYLELEITESAAMTQVEANIETLARLRKMGIDLAIDDFGTAYSSLNYLKRLPISHLKIDRSFLQDIHDDPEESPQDAAIIRAIVALAKNLGFTVVAEGLETPAQVQFLRSLGCDKGQGYLFSRPLPAERVYELLRGHYLRR